MLYVWLLIFFLIFLFLIWREILIKGCLLKKDFKNLGIMNVVIYEDMIIFNFDWNIVFLSWICLILFLYCLIKFCVIGRNVWLFLVKIIWFL